MKGNATQLSLEAAAAWRGYHATVECLNVRSAIRPIRRRALVNEWMRLAGARGY